MKSPRLERTVAPPAIIVALACLLGGAGAAAAFESDTVGSFWGGLWWALCLMTTVGYVYGPPDTATATVVSAVLIVVGFVLLSLLSATLAAVFIRTDEEPAERLSTDLEREILTRLEEISRRVEALEKRLP
ncbi:MULTISPECIES: ion channel [unclassified Nocardioides]|uniref:ion channel n=1 Tax=unclassified Nocardioides TaxID=2615069 RepID=UPI0009EFE735|nr:MULTISPECIES: ion channel [unclassified Nocardioides]GAW49533.1 Ion transport 2 domain protein (Precursor) [Nocardioides sp. PD653-B2]GAW54953.1 Ion transport 2 domain protein (Precursor) [Nocardioides sp. PD653]